MPAGRSAVSLGEALFEVLTECQNVAVFPHRDGEADSVAAVVSEHRLLRVGVASLHLGDVAQPEKPAIEAEVDGLQALFGRELTRDANRNLLCLRVHCPARLDRVLRLQRLYQLGNVEPHGGELLGRELQIDFLVLGPEQVDLGNIGNAEQLGSHALGIIAQLAVGEAIRSQREDQGIRIAELVVEERTLHALRQRLFDVADLFSNLVPEIGHVRGTGGVLQIHEHHRLPRLGVALQIVNVRQLFELLLDPVRDLPHRLQRGGPGPQRLHHHRLDGEGRVLVAAQPADIPKCRRARRAASGRRRSSYAPAPSARG